MPERVLKILQQEEAIYSELRNLVQEKQEALLAKDMDRLAAVAKSEEERVERINSLEKERLDAMRDVAASLGKEPEEIRSSEMESLLGGAQAGAFRGTVDRLKALLKEIGEVNELNAMLLEQSMEVIDYTLKVLTSLENRIGGYGKEGTAQGSKGPGPSALFDRKG